MDYGEDLRSLCQQMDFDFLLQNILVLTRLETHLDNAGNDGVRELKITSLFN